MTSTYGEKSTEFVDTKLGTFHLIRGSCPPPQILSVPSAQSVPEKLASFDCTIGDLCGSRFWFILVSGRCWCVSRG